MNTRLTDWRRRVRGAALGLAGLAALALAAPAQAGGGVSIHFGAPYYDAAMRRVSWARRWGRRVLPAVRHLFKIIRLSLSPPPEQPT